jgi:transaldolase
MGRKTEYSPAESVGLARPIRPKLFGDGASLEEFGALYAGGVVSGFTTNPSLMFRAGVTDYAGFAQRLLAMIPDLPVSLEVFSDDLAEMERQARLIAAWGENVYVKVPIMNTRRASTLPLIRRMSACGIKVNVTAILGLDQAAAAIDAVSDGAAAIISIFAGRIADTGVDPVPTVAAAVELARAKPLVDILWASVREPLNIYQARDCGCHIVTCPADILAKRRMAGQDLIELSRETVAMFHRDATAAGYTL